MDSSKSILTHLLRLFYSYIHKLTVACTEVVRADYSISLTEVYCTYEWSLISLTAGV